MYMQHSSRIPDKELNNLIYGSPFYIIIHKNYADAWSLLFVLSKMPRTSASILTEQDMSTFIHHSGLYGEKKKKTE